jgi:MoxR-like ATPase
MEAMSGYCRALWSEIKTSFDEKLYFGNSELLELVLIAYLARGHVLVEGPPGTGKTLVAKLFAHKLARSFKRIQFTSDLLPGDILGSHVYSPSTGSFRFIPGPIFSDIVLADEINRTPPRTQSALLEAMEERQVTIEGECMPLSPSFFVIATQNPLEMEGTFPLPEAHVDRFLFKIKVGHADRKTEQRMLDSILSGKLPPQFGEISSINCSFQDVDREIEAVRVDPVLLDYTSQLLEQTRTSQMLAHGSSIRGGIALIKSARIRALLEGRSFVIPDDIKHFCRYTLPHRVRPSTEAQVSRVLEEDIITEIVKRVPLPALAS